MSEYNIGFGDKLIAAAKFVSDEGLESEDAKRTVLYLCKLASEISLKALLEKTGKSVKEISSCRHDLSGLLRELGKCSIEKEIAVGVFERQRASVIRAIPVYGNTTVENILESEKHGASKYPNEIRYGSTVRDYPPEIWLKTATAVVEWAHKYWDTIRA